MHTHTHTHTYCSWFERQLRVQNWYNLFLNCNCHKKLIISILKHGVNLKSSSIYIYTHIYTHIYPQYMYTHVRVYTHTYTYMRMCIYMYEYIHLYMSVGRYMYIYLYTYMYKYVLASFFIYICVCVCVCVCIFLYHSLSLSLSLFVPFSIIPSSPPLSLFLFESSMFDHLTRINSYPRMPFWNFFLTTLICTRDRFISGWEFVILSYWPFFA